MRAEIKFPLDSSLLDTPRHGSSLEDLSPGYLLISPQDCLHT